MFLNKVIKNIITEADNILKTTANKPIVDAIKNRRKITFDYYGPRSPKKDSVRPGKRIKVEPVSMGLSKRGNLIIRAWVEPPSVTKSGFEKGNWRTFILSRTRNIQITDETFDTKRPGYKEGSDKSMSVTYVTTDWTKKPTIKKYEKPTPKPTIKVEPTAKQEPTKVEPKPIEPIAKKSEPLPQPEPKEKPQSEPKPSEPEVKTPEIEPVQQELPQPKPKETPKEEPEEEPEVKPEDQENKNLQENIQRIKSLLFSKI